MLNMFRKNRDLLPASLAVRADDLAKWAYGCAIGTFPMLSKKFPILKRCDEDHFDFIYTIASIYMTSLQLKKLHKSHQRELIRRIETGLEQWDSLNGLKCLKHCQAFFERTYTGLSKLDPGGKLIQGDTIGTFVFWEVFGHAPEMEESGLARTIGILLTTENLGWWDK